MVTQMIMGGGKTTVVAPLVALMLGDGQNLVTQVVPSALLEFSRAILRSRFSAIFHKPLYTFSFDRFTEVTPALCAKLLKAKKERGIVITTPTAIKSFQLKFVEMMHLLDQASTTGVPSVQECHEIRNQVEQAARVLQIWKRSSLILDEVDLILHPLKSELNYPIGHKEVLDFTNNKAGKGLRWEVPYYLMDAIFYCTEGRMYTSAQDSRQMESILERLKEVVEQGAKERVLQRVPHLVLLRQDFYFRHMKPLLIEWLMVWLAIKGMKGVSDDEARAYLTRGPKDRRAAHPIQTKLSGDYTKMINLCHDWLQSYLPHVLSKINRVSYGLLSKEDLAKALTEDQLMPKTRKLLAVPFVGKDVPSRASEFAHPDVVIGMTILAYRHEGMRQTDFFEVLKNLRLQMSKEVGPYEKRKACRAFATWVTAMGARVRGDRRAERETELGIGKRRMSAFVVPEAVELEGDLNIWPLRLIDIHDPDQFAVLFKLLKRSAHAVHYHLSDFVFPELMRHQGLKLSSCGVDLGGEMLFARRLGFSGTPSDLLPLELGRCQYEKASDGKMISYLTDPRICSHEVMGLEWSVKSLLTNIAASSAPPFHALIDTGALITGMTNLEVASFLLDHGLVGLDGVVFLDEADRKMILVRASRRVQKLEQSGIPLERRFAFYDDVHTTGMDIKHTSNAVACVTLGQHMTFRDYAQGDSLRTL
jgi:hypothetical protein